MIEAAQALAAPGVRVVRADFDEAAWGRFVATAPGSTYAHHPGWAAVMRDGLGHEMIGLVALGEDGEWRGALPLVHVRSPVFGSYLVSLPFVNYGGPLGDAEACVALAAAALREAERRRVDLLELRGRVEGGAARMTEVARKVTVLLDLHDTSESLLKWFPSKLRSQIRRPQKAGMVAGFGAAEVGDFYQVFARNMRDLGTPVLPRRFFESMAAEMGEMMICSVVRHEGQPVAAGIGFLWNDCFEITWASSLREFNRLSPNMLLYWSFMEEAIARGAKVFDFGRCTPDGNTHRFKRQWGGETVELPWTQWSPKGVASTPSPESPIFQMATRAWARLPLPVANRLGPLLARQIP